MAAHVCGRSEFCFYILRLPQVILESNFTFYSSRFLQVYFYFYSSSFEGAYFDL